MMNCFAACVSSQRSCLSARRRLSAAICRSMIHQLCGLFQIVVLLCGFNLAVDLLNLFTQLLHAANRVLFVFPLRFHGVELVALFGQLLLQLTEPSL